MIPSVTKVSIPYSIVVPARNEEETIGQVLRNIQNMTDDLIVVDGHSTDRTVAIAEQYGARVIQDNRRGKGNAVRLGLAVAQHAITVFIDADGSHDPTDIPKLIAPIAAGEADLVIGSRMLGGSEELFGCVSEVIRLLGSLVISLSINYRYGVRLTDYQNGFRAIRTEVGRRIGLTSNITTIEQEMAMKCLKYGYRVVELPAHEYRRKGGISKINVMRVAHIYVWNLLCGLLGLRRVKAETSSTPAAPLDGAPMLASEKPLLRAAVARVCPVCGTSAKQSPVVFHGNLQLSRCTGCDLVYQARRPTAVEMATTYGSDYYNYWGLEKDFEVLWNMKVKTCNAYVDLLRRHLQGAVSSFKMLDIGCAHGFMLEAARQSGFHAVGIEISPAAAVARERGFTVYDWPLQELCLPAEEFDAVTIVDVIEHIPDPEPFMKEVYRILKPQGAVLIVTPDVESKTAQMMKARWPHYKLEHVVYFSERSLSLLLRKTGFSVRRIERGFKYLTFEYVLRHFQKYAPGWMSTALAFLHSVLPDFLTRTPVRLPTEMLAIVQRGTASRPGGLTQPSSTGD